MVYNNWEKSVSSRILIEYSKLLTERPALVATDFNSEREGIPNRSEEIAAVKEERERNIKSAIKERMGHFS